MEITFVYVAVGAIALAFVINALKNSSLATETEEGAKVSIQPKRMYNNQGWRAPEGYFFSENNELIGENGDLIVDTLIIAKRCGEITEEQITHLEDCHVAIEEVAPTKEAIVSGKSVTCI